MARRQTTCAAAIIGVMVTAFVIIPLTARAQEPVKVIEPGVVAAAGLVTEARRLFDTPSLVRAIEADRGLQAMMHAQRSMAGAPNVHIPWKAVLTGAGVGALAGGVLAAIGGSSTDGPDYGGGSGMIGGAGPAFVVGVVVGAAIGAGIGLVVGLLTK